MSIQAPLEIFFLFFFDIKEESNIALNLIRVPWLIDNRALPDKGAKFCRTFDRVSYSVLEEELS